MSWETENIVAHHLLDRMEPVDKDAPEHFSNDWAAAHATFHLALLSGCSNRRLLRFAGSLRDSAEVYRRWSVPHTRDSREEHRAILAAALDRDVELAAGLLEEHIRRTNYQFVDLS